MAVLHPFRAVRPRPDLAEEIACVPYDVINTDEARSLSAGNSRSFLHVIRPEIDLPEGTSEYADEVYKKGADNLTSYVAGPDSLEEVEPSVYVYRLIMNSREQTGVFGCVSVEDYDNDVILKHEKTRPSKEDDRTRHIITQSAHAEPVMLTFRDHASVASLIVETKVSEPLYDFTAPDGVRHTIWAVDDSKRMVEYFSEIEKLYVADGHHRCKSASRAVESFSDSESIPAEVWFFPAVLFPMGDMLIMAYNRIIRTLPSAPEEFLDTLKARFRHRRTENPVPEKKGEIAVYLNGQWTMFELPVDNQGSVVERLDVGLLSKEILEPLLDITDPRTDSNIDFVGGIRGTGELERLVDEGKAEMAISMYPTSTQELIDVSDAGLLMPPKSTWFEPKLRSGLLVHLF